MSQPPPVPNQYLYSNAITSLKSETFNGLNKLKNLSSHNTQSTPSFIEYLQSNAITSIESGVFSCLTSLENLERHNTHNTQDALLCFIPNRHLFQLHCLSRVRHVHWSHTVGIPAIQQHNLHNQDTSQTCIPTLSRPSNPKHSLVSHC